MRTHEGVAKDNNNNLIWSKGSISTCRSKGSVPGAWIFTVKPVSWMTITSCSFESSSLSASLLPTCFDSASSVCS